MAIEVRPLAGDNAYEVLGVELWRPLEVGVLAAVREAWSKTGVLVFRRQALSEDEMVAFSERLGELEVIVRTDWQSPKRPEVIQISNMKDAEGRSIGGLGSGELDWHTDQSYMRDPATGCALYMVEMPPAGGMTYWASLTRAYHELDDATKAAIEGKHACFDYLARQSTYDDEAPMSPALRRQTPVVAHPLVNRHPDTGVCALYLDPTTTVGIHELPGEPGDRLLAELNAHATSARFVYAHQWQIGDVVLWDNAVVLHRRDPFDPRSNRLLKRTTFRLDPSHHIVPSGFHL